MPLRRFVTACVFAAKSEGVSTTFHIPNMYLKDTVLVVLLEIGSWENEYELKFHIVHIEGECEKRGLAVV